LKDLITLFKIKIRKFKHSKQNVLKVIIQQDSSRI